MSLQGPLLVLSGRDATETAAALQRAGAFPVVEAGWDEAATALAQVQPTALVIVATDRTQLQVEAILSQAAALGGPLVPVLALDAGGASGWPVSVLPIYADAAPERLVACLRAALRVRTLHAAVLRRLGAGGESLPLFPETDPMEDTTVLVAGRGRSYPALTTAFGERAGLIGALSLETAAGYLEARDVDALVIGDGFNRKDVAAVLDRLGSDPRFRDLPMSVLDAHLPEFDPSRMPLLQQVGGDPEVAAQRTLPYARLHAFSGRLKRMIAALDAKGVIDPDTGLYTRDAFVRDFNRAVGAAEARGSALSLARLSFDASTQPRTSKDAARIAGRLVRAGDFACRDRDGSILMAFMETDLGAAHVVARRIASILRHTMLAPDQDRNALTPTVSVAAYKGRDNAASLLARVTPARVVAAE